MIDHALSCIDFSRPRSKMNISIYWRYCVIALLVSITGILSQRTGAVIGIKKDSPYFAIRNEVERLRKELANETLVRCGSIRKINGTLERLMVGLLRQQHDTTAADANAYAELLWRKINLEHNALEDEVVLRLLRSFIGVNRILTEIGFVLPRPPSNRENLLFRKVLRTKTSDIGQMPEELTTISVTYNRSDSVFRDWKTVQNNFYSRKSSVNRADETWMKGVGMPTLALEKHCANGKTWNKKAQWRLVILLRTPTFSLESSVTMFYVTFPLNKIDLNQCDENAHDMLRSTHGCTNSSSTSCVFIPGGGFELGHYECCCQAKDNNASGWLWQRQERRQLQRLFLQKYENCFDGREVERERMLGRPFPGHCVDYFQSDTALRRTLLAINILCALGAFASIFVVTSQRKVKDWGARGWALMEFFLVGAILLYCIVILEYFEPTTSSCSLIPWCRELGFALFYGAVVLKIHRNLFEHGVRKANYVFIKEKDLLKYLLCIVAFTLIGLLAWTVTAMQATTEPPHLSSESSDFNSAVISHGRSDSGDIYAVCTFFHWNLIWHTLEFGFLSYGAYQSWRARTTTWNEKYQFSAAVALEMIVSLNVIIIKKHIWLDSSPDTLLMLSFFHAHFTVTVVVVTIMATKLYHARLAPTARDHSTASSGVNRMHPSLAKLRDNLMNGTVDIADMPIGELNPEDIRAELKRVYTQLRMYKLTNLYMDNPHISKRKGGKKTSNKQTNRRISIPTVPSKTSHKEMTRPTNAVEVDERSSLTKHAVDDEPMSAGSIVDLTVHTSPHNVHFSKMVTTTMVKSDKIPLDVDLSVCI